MSSTWVYEFVRCRNSWRLSDAWAINTHRRLLVSSCFLLYSPPLFRFVPRDLSFKYRLLSEESQVHNSLLYQHKNLQQIFFDNFLTNCQRHFLQKMFILHLNKTCFTIYKRKSNEFSSFSVIWTMTERSCSGEVIELRPNFVDWLSFVNWVTENWTRFFCSNRIIIIASF